MALITIFYFAVILTSLTLLLLTLISLKQNELVRLRRQLQAENNAQSGLEIFIARSRSNGGPIEGFTADLPSGIVTVSTETHHNMLTVTSLGAHNPGNQTYHRTLKRNYRLY